MKIAIVKAITLLVASALLACTAVYAAEAGRTPLGATRYFCNVESCSHTEGEHCAAYVAPHFSYSGTARLSGTGHYYSQLENTVTKRALDALDAYYNPTNVDIPAARLGVIEVHSLPAGLTEQNLTAIAQQMLDTMCVERPQYYWMDMNNLRFGIQSGERSSVLVMDFSDRLLNTYWSSSLLVTQEGREAEEQAQNALLRLNGVQEDTERLRILHDFILERTEYTYEIEQAYSFTGVLVYGRALCEGYSKAFQLLARRAGYECELIVGMATRPDGSLEAHMWNRVQVNQKWYMVDCTWDDSELLSRGDRYRYFMLDAEQAQALDDHAADGNINRRRLPNGLPQPEVKVFAFPPLA